MALKRTVSELSGTLLSIVRTRLELFSLEAAGQWERLLRLLGMLFGALLFLTLALLIFSVLVVLYFWPGEYRYIALLALVVFYFVLGAGCLFALRKNLVDGPPPFQATLDELHRDIQLAGRLSGRGPDDNADAGTSRNAP